MEAQFVQKPKIAGLSDAAFDSRHASAAPQCISHDVALQPDVPDNSSDLPTFPQTLLAIPLI
jgi:hypothetical protein